MVLEDIIITLISGEALAVIFSDFWRGRAGYLLLKWLFLFLLPVLSIIVFWFVEIVSKRFISILQFIKYCFVGIVSTLVDLKIFEFVLWLFGFNMAILSGIAKSISFLVSVFVKFLGNKYWTFQEKGKENIGQEFIGFLIITFLGLIIDISSFFFFVKIVGPQFGLSVQLWTKASVIIAALIAAIWNFLGYKFFIFKTKTLPT